jgi:hypothetical protein
MSDQQPDLFTFHANHRERLSPEGSDAGQVPRAKAEPASVKSPTVIDGIRLRRSSSQTTRAFLGAVDVTRHCSPSPPIQNISELEEARERLPPSRYISDRAAHACSGAAIR